MCGWYLLKKQVGMSNSEEPPANNSKTLTKITTQSIHQRLHLLDVQMMMYQCYKDENLSANRKVF